MGHSCSCIYEKHFCNALSPRNKRLGLPIPFPFCLETFFLSRFRDRKNDVAERECTFHMLDILPHIAPPHFGPTLYPTGAHQKTIGRWRDGGRRGRLARVGEVRGGFDWSLVIRAFTMATAMVHDKNNNKMMTKMMIVRMMLAIVMTTTMMSARVEATDSVAGVLTVGDLVISGNNATSLVGVQHVAGDLVITNASTLAGLEKLKIVEGSLEIRDNPTLTTLDGLQNLQCVGDSLEIKRNDGINSLSGLSKLEAVGGDLHVGWNKNLNSLQNLQNLVSLGENLMIEGNDNLSSLWGVHGLTRVENATIASNEKLLSLAGLALSEVKGDFSAVRNENLMSLQGLESLTRVDGNLMIETGGTFLALKSLTTVGGNFTLESKDDVLAALKSVDNDLSPLLAEKVKFEAVLNDDNAVAKAGFAAAERGGIFPGSLRIEENVTSLTGLSGIKGIKGDLVTYENKNSIPSFAGLEALESIGGSLGFSESGFGNLQSIEGLERLTHIGGDFFLFRSTLPSLRGLQNLRSIGGSFRAKYSGLSSFEDLKSLRSIGGELLLDSAGSFTSLAGLEQLEDIGLSIGGGLSIIHSSLVSLDGLQGLRFVKGNVNIEYNDELSSVESLKGLRAVKGNLTIESTDPQDVVRLLDSFLADIAEKAKFVTILTNDNAVASAGFAAAERGGIFPGSLRIEENVTSLSDLETLTHLPGDLEIMDNDNLITLAGLNNLSQVNGNIYITRNKNLQSLDGLSALRSVGGDVTIDYNKKLSTLADLQDLVWVMGKKEISHNGEI